MSNRSAVAVILRCRCAAGHEWPVLLPRCWVDLAALRCQCGEPMIAVCGEVSRWPASEAFVEDGQAFGEGDKHGTHGTDRPQ